MSILSKLVVVGLAATQAYSVAAAEDECYCSSGCTVQADPHVITFEHVKYDLLTAGNRTLYNFPEGYDLTTFVSAKNNLYYQTKVNVEGTQYTTDDCNGHANTVLFDKQQNIPVPEGSGLSSQTVSTKVVCHYGPENCEEKNICQMYLDVLVNKTDYFAVDSALNIKGQSFMNIEQNVLKSEGDCLKESIDNLRGIIPPEPECYCPPTSAPTKAPTNAPTTGTPTTGTPTLAPTNAPTTLAPTQAPTNAPTTLAPTQAPTGAPTTLAPTQAPTGAPTTLAPTQAPTGAPTTLAPTLEPTTAPTTAVPSQSPTVITLAPSTLTPTPPFKPKNCTCKGSCTGQADPHFVTFDGAKLKSGTANETLSIYETNNFDIKALVTGDKQRNFMTTVYINGEVQRATSCQHANSVQHYTKTVSDKDIKQTLDASVTCKYGPTGCYERGGDESNFCRWYLNVALQKTDEFVSTTVEDPENFMSIESEYLKAQGECMIEDETSEDKKDWECTCDSA